jgi:hypothetical protein
LCSAALSFGFSGDCTMNYTSSDFYNMMAVISKHRLATIGKPMTVVLRACRIGRSLADIKDFLKTVQA